MDTNKLEKVADVIADAGVASGNQVFRFGDVVSVTGDTVTVDINGAQVPTVKACNPAVGARVLIAIHDTIWMCLAVVGGCPYSVNDLYITTDTGNPNTKWPGTTWQAYGAGQVLVGVNTSDTDFNAVGKTGGAKTIALTTAQMPSHSGHVPTSASGGNAYGRYLATTSMTSYGSSGRGWQEVSNGEALPVGTSLGNGEAHNNMPPYVTVYMWKRTA